MLSLASLITALFTAPTEPTVLCPDGAEVTGSGPPHGSSWACVIRNGDGAPTRHGWSVDYWPNGNEKSACEYDYDVKHGRCSTWSEDGRLATRGTYERGKPAGYWWFWGALETLLYDPDGAAIRLTMIDTMVSLGVAESDAMPIVEYVIAHHRDAHADIRAAAQLCTLSACVSTATIENQTVLAIQFGPPADKAAGSGEVLAEFTGKAKTVHAEIRQERIRRERKYEQAQAGYDKQVRSWEYTRLECNDGTRSPSCVCGGEYRGCCSHHGGVAGCPRDYPETPAPDTSPLIPNELLTATD